MGHGHHLGREHSQLGQRLQHGSLAFVEPATPTARAAWQDILETLFSPSEAALAARMPILPTDLDTIAGRLGLEPKALRPQLERLADQGLVMDVAHPRTGETVYMLAPPMIGFFDFSLMRLGDGLPKAKLARAYDAYLRDDPAFLEEASRGETRIGRTLVRESTRFDDLVSEVLDWERASSYLESAALISVGLCFCRHRALHRGEECAYGSMETCMSLGAAADYLIRHGFAREISREEGRERLASARESGLVHIADNVREGLTYICSCCPDCCEELRSVRVGRSMVVPSGFQPRPAAEKCTACGRCAKACPVQALSLRQTGAWKESAAERRLGPALDSSRCIGCGLCAQSCRQKCLSMERRPSQPHVPGDVVEFLVRSMMERGRVADLLVDGSTGRGPAFANAVLRVVFSLPLAERLIASEALRSRFVKYALSRI